MNRQAVKKKTDAVPQKTGIRKTRNSQKQQWEQSEAVYHYHMHDTSAREHKKKSVTGFLDQEKDGCGAGRMREIFKAENSYGVIAAGVSRKKEAVAVFSQKREHDGPVTKESQKNLRMERAKRQIMPAGNIYLNPDMEKEGAAAFVGKQEMPFQKAAGQIYRYADEKGSRMLEKRMPFLGLKQEREKAAKLDQLRRKSRETGDVRQAQMLEDQVQQLKSRITQQEQAQRQIMKKLRDAWKKAGQFSPDDFRHQVFETTAQAAAEGLPEQEEGDEGLCEGNAGKREAGGAVIGKLKTDMF